MSLLPTDLPSIVRFTSFAFGDYNFGRTFSIALYKPHVPSMWATADYGDDTDIYGTFLACVLCHGILASVMSKIMGKLQTVFVVMNFILIFATIIALPIGARYHRNDGHYIFADTENLTTWPTGWAFMLAWLSPIWTIGMCKRSEVLVIFTIC